MAELASGAVGSLLGLIGQNEAQLLGGVRDDVEFIREEMESMYSFLSYLARTAPPGGLQDELVRTWMKQVRDLAHDCSNCIDRYLYRQSDNHLAKSGLRRYLGWAPWLLRRMVAQHRAAIQLSELKERARDVGERRLRYGIDISTGAAAEEEDDQEGDGARRTTTTVDDYFNKKLVEWISKTRRPAPTTDPIPSILFLLPDTQGGSRDIELSHHALAMAQAHFSRLSVLVDVPMVHWDPLPLRPKEILYYILREIKLISKSQELPQGPGNEDSWLTKWGIYHGKKSLLRDIKNNIKEMQVDGKFDVVVDNVTRKMEGDQLLLLLQDLEKTEKELKEEITKQPLHVLLRLLIRSTAALAEQDKPSKKALLTLSVLYDDIIKKTAKKLEEHMEDKQSSKQLVPSIRLRSTEFEDILKEVFPIKMTTTITTTTTSTNISNSTLVEDQIKEVIYKVLQELQVDRSSKNQEIHEQDIIQEATFKQAAMEKIKQIKQNVREQMKIKGIMYEIQNHLNGERILIILKTNHKNASIPEETIKTLRLLGVSGCFAGAAIVTTTTTEMIRQARKYFCYPQLELIEYSRVGRYLDTVLQYTSQHVLEDNHQLLRGILEECEREPDEFCMKILAHALKAKPKRSLDELRKLHSILQVTPKSLLSTKMLEFSYSDLPGQHKSCLLYLSIFPPAPDPEAKIRRSTLIGRWAAEGLINTEAWTWSSSVAEAKKCFDALIDRCLICPADISATGRAKSCTVDRIVHGFIIKIAMKQRIVGIRMLHLARYFSFFNDVHLRSSDTIETFLQKISDLSHFSKLKVLDLEGCHYFAKNQRYLKDICRKLIMLKYLSLRGTDVTQLPHEINNLHELEVLDIRQTNIPASATRNVLLIKLKRLLAGYTDTGPSNTGTSIAKDFSCLQIPEMIKKMKDVEVLSNVKPMEQGDLKNIKGLSQLKKLGVVIDKDNHLKDLLEVLGSDLGRGLRSLAIALDIMRSEGSTHRIDLKLEALESLSISGSTQTWLLLLLANQHCKILTKLTLSRTSVDQHGLKILTKFPELRCLRLRDMAYTDSELTFKKDEFPKLKILIVNSSNITKIAFNGGSPELEKIIWSFTTMESLSGIDSLPRLRYLELIGNKVPSKLQQDISSLYGLDYKHYKESKNQDQATGTAQEEDNGVSRQSLF
ncbi:unnamed protein product [Urochloa decumbens]|uniref:Rx N-terminal domain-containing protein n=1 Tax=Urochloa decumbens TaxID=240449 RepID=A0ABC9CB13_9POAL